MSQRDLSLFLEDILASIEKIYRYTTGMSYDEFAENELVVDAVLRNLEVIGEAAGHMPPEIRQTYQQIPWRRVVGLRNVVIHAYFNVDLSIVWQIVQNNLPSIEPDLRKLIQELKQNNDSS